MEDTAALAALIREHRFTMPSGARRRLPLTPEVLHGDLAIAGRVVGRPGEALRIVIDASSADDLLVVCFEGGTRLEVRAPEDVEVLSPGFIIGRAASVLWGPEPGEGGALDPRESISLLRDGEQLSERWPGRPSPSGRDAAWDDSPAVELIGALLPPAPRRGLL